MINLLKLRLSDPAADRVRRNHEQIIEELQQEIRELRARSDRLVSAGLKTRDYTLGDGERYVEVSTDVGDVDVKAPANPRDGEMVSVSKVTTGGNVNLVANSGQTVARSLVRSLSVARWVWVARVATWHRVNGDVAI